MLIVASQFILLLILCLLIIGKDKLKQRKKQDQETDLIPLGTEKILKFPTSPGYPDRLFTTMIFPAYYGYAYDFKKNKRVKVRFDDWKNNRGRFGVIRWKK